MEISIIDGDGQAQVVHVHEGETLLSVLQRAGVPVTAFCGGNGTCGKCEVAVRTVSGLSRVLACRTQPEDGMVVYTGDIAGIRVESTASTETFEGAVDEAAVGDVGVAVDLGTTTIACYLYDLHDGRLLASEGAANPQASFGADVISRIQACSQGSLGMLQESAATRIRLLAQRMCHTSGVDEACIRRWALAGNTTMEHIICGVSPESIGVAPFTPTTLFGKVCAVEGIASHVYMASCVSGYVGGDITAGLLACCLDETQRTILFADLGTNGELALAAGGKLYCCATATGPAFEGANIAMGMQARAGAIDSCHIENGRFQLTTVDGAPAIGLCGSGLIDALASCLDAGLVDETGRILDDDELPEGTDGLLGTFHTERAILLVPDGSVVLTQGDVRALQLAKAAVCAGLLTLLGAAGLDTEDVDEVMIGGAFGAHLNARSAAACGIFPADLLPVVRMVGNCAGRGISQALLSQQQRMRMEDIAHRISYIELSCDAEFADAYIEAMVFGEER